MGSGFLPNRFQGVKLVRRGEPGRTLHVQTAGTQSRAVRPDRNADTDNDLADAYQQMKARGRWATRSIGTADRAVRVWPSGLQAKRAAKVARCRKEHRSTGYVRLPPPPPQPTPPPHDVAGPGSFDSQRTCWRGGSWSGGVRYVAASQAGWDQHRNPDDAASRGK